MKIFALSCLMAFSTLSPDLQAAAPHTDVSQKAKPATIKVLVAKKAKGALLEVKGRYQICNPSDNLEITSSTTGKRDFIEPSQVFLKWGDNLPPSISRMRVVPQDSQTTILVNGIQYKGCIDVYCMNGVLNIVNEIDLESYLKSTLTTQFQEEMDKEVMDAVAIIARTSAYFFISRNNTALWHVEAKDVGYLGYGVTLQNLPVERAIESTKHAVLTFNSQPFAATWTQDSAGKTADYASVFRKNVQTPGGVNAPFAAKDREKRAWAFTINKKQLAKAVGMANVLSAELFQDKVSGKVYGLRVNDGTQTKEIEFIKLQHALGKTKLRSNDFALEIKGEKVTFSGHGEGLGVGLCLYSATKMAKHGDKTQTILSSFFPNTKIESRRS